MNVKELKEILKDFDEDLEVCVLKNGGQGYGELPFKVTPKLKKVLTYEGVYKEMVVMD